MDLLDGIMDKVEGVLPMEGPLAVPLRAAIGGGLGWLLIAALRPNFAYDAQTNQPRPWAVLPELYQGQGTPTHLPFLVGPLAGAVLLAGFV
jgi:hypothetical protein